MILKGAPYHIPNQLFLIIILSDDNVDEKRFQRKRFLNHAWLAPLSKAWLLLLHSNLFLKFCQNQCYSNTFSNSMLLLNLMMMLIMTMMLMIQSFQGSSCVQNWLAPLSKAWLLHPNLFLEFRQNQDETADIDKGDEKCVNSL